MAEKEQSKQTSSDAWKEVGDQFAAFGENLAAAFRRAWEDEGNQQALARREGRAAIDGVVCGAGGR